jgi:hypothetical protein
MSEASSMDAGCARRFSRTVVVRDETGLLPRPACRSDFHFIEQDHGTHKPIDPRQGHGPVEPPANGFLNHVSKAQIVQALKEAGPDWRATAWRA